MKKALIIYGGWDGHEPLQVAQYYQELFLGEGFIVEMYDSLEPLNSLEFVSTFDVFVPIWTMGEITKEQAEHVSEAVAGGMGLIGCHGGMCDAFRSNVLWQFMTGGNWVSHPGGDGVEYKVHIKQSSSPLTEGIADFTVCSEHYYLHVDPAVEVLATTSFPIVDWYHSTNGKVDMPVIWTKRWGHGRVYYNSLGHHADILYPSNMKELMRRGIQWVFEGKEIAVRDGLTSEMFKSEKPMY
jgi:type 1 glutamine amidotransferase